MNDFIEKLGLQKHPEGGYYRRTYQSERMIELPGDYSGKRHLGTAIYYLLEKNDFAAWHRLKQDELWHFYAGTSLTVHVIDHAKKLTSHVLGNPLLEKNAEFQLAVTGNQWFAAELNDPTSFALVGCNVVPGFDFADWELGERQTLVKQYPEYAELMTRLSR